MTPKQLHAAIAILRQEVPHWDAPVVTLMAQEKREPYRVLISTLLSLRTQDQTTAKASQRLFAWLIPRKSCCCWTVDHRAGHLSSGVLP
jgi:endonuclease-3